ncbi:MAG: right-handed parallel beta-helix repeat-containing protein [Lachnospiraceae bacterium]|nr:right-handed parallel beta-helix repeat-containing protein [Lachnospiraceae bacterium]
MDINVLEYGALGDGSINDRAAIQRAIDDCADNGGGRVTLPGGHCYRSGALVLRSFVELHLEMGAELKALDDMAGLDLFGKAGSVKKGLERPTYEACDYDGAPSLYFIYCKDAENVAITGLGRINGNEEIFYGEVTKYHIDGSFYPRAPLLYLVNVRHLTIEDVTLTGSAFWTTHMIGCRDVLIRGIRILNNLRLANCDGIDPDHCSNVRIIGCHIETADDCIVFKNTAQFMEYGPCENIVVSDCTLMSTSAAIKFGSESEDLFRNITVSNCVISRTNRAISMMLRDKGSIENVTFSNIMIDTRLFSKLHWWGSAEPVAITVVRRKEDIEPGMIRNVVFRDITASGENGIFIYDELGGHVDGIAFDQVTLSLIRKTDHPRDTYDIRPYWGEGLIKEPLHAVWIKNAKGISFRNFRVNIEEGLKSLVKDPIRLDNSEVGGLTP